MCLPFSHLHPDASKIVTTKINEGKRERKRNRESTKFSNLPISLYR